MFALRDALWSFPTVLFICIFGAYFTFGLLKKGALGVSGIKNAVKEYYSSSSGGISPLASLATALGGTVGIGSISGVGLALSVGGAGSMLWFWICGFLCMGIKYAEVVCASKNRILDGDIAVGGTMYSLSAKNHKLLAVLFAVLCIFASFGTGNMTQGAAVGEIMAQKGVPPIITAIFLSLFMGFAIFGGQKSISKVSSFLVPAAGGIYISLCLYLLLMGCNNLPNVFSDIFSQGLGLKQLAGGTCGSALSVALSTGFTRCIFSNEAGMGTSPMAHASASSVSYSAQGTMGTFEIIADSFVFSTLTALSMLCHSTTDIYHLFSSKLFGFGRIILPILLVIFAYSAIIAWCYYGESCLTFLFPNKSKHAKAVYRIASVAICFAGVLLSSEAAWCIADIMNALMLFPTLTDLFINRKEILK